MEKVNHPNHYNQSNLECIEIVRELPFNVGCAIKYIWRWQDKNGIEDLKKAEWYITDEIQKLENPTWLTVLRSWARINDFGLVPIAKLYKDDVIQKVLNNFNDRPLERDMVINIMSMYSPGNFNLTDYHYEFWDYVQNNLSVLLSTAIGDDHETN